MAYNRRHVVNFLALAELPEEDRKVILKRADAAAEEFSSRQEGNFSGGSLGDVLGNPDLENQFHDLWEKQKLH